jgi:hypothetical protein
LRYLRGESWGDSNDLLNLSGYFCKGFVQRGRTNNRSIISWNELEFTESGFFPQALSQQDRNDFDFFPLQACHGFLYFDAIAVI